MWGLSFSWAQSYAAAPANDPFFGAQYLGDTNSGSVLGSNVGATAQVGEPAVNSGGHSVWYRWVSPVSGNATLHTGGSDFSTLLAVFSQSPDGNDTQAGVVLVASTNNGSSSAITWSTHAGNVYWFAVDGVGGATGNIVLNWQVVPDGRLPDLVPSIEEPTAGGVRSAPTACEVGHGCGTTNTQRVLRFGTLTRNIGVTDLYLRGIPNLQYEYHPCHFHTHLVGYAAYRLLSNGVPVVTGAKASFCLQDSSPYATNAWPRPRFTCSVQGMSRGWGDYYWPALPCQWIDITGVPPGRYTLQVEIDPNGQLPESNESNNVASLEVYLSATATHVNETWETARPITGARFEIQSENIGATGDAGEPIIGAGHTVWYRWVAPSNGLVSFDVVGSYIPARIGVFTGTALSNLTAVPNVDPFPATAANQRVIFQATAGATYHIVVDSAQSNATGVFKLNGWMGSPPNDHFTNAQGWVSLDANLQLSTVQATKEPGEPDHAGNAGGRSVWIPFTAPVSRPITIETGGSDFDTLLAIYTGTSLSDLEEIASNDDLDASRLWSRVTIDAEEGEQYWIAIDGHNGAGGRVQYSIWETAPPLQFLHVSVHHGKVELELTGERTRVYRIESSTNLVHWVPMQSFEMQGPTLHVHLPYETNLPVRFYRALKLQDNN